MSFGSQKAEFDRFFNRLDRPVEESRPDRPVDPTGAGRPDRFPSLARGSARCKFGLVITWLVGVTIFGPFFENNSVIHFYLAGFYPQNTFKKNLPWKMRIEQIIELQLRGLGPLAEHVLLQLVIFMTKHKSLKIIFE